MKRKKNKKEKNRKKHPILRRIFLGLLGVAVIAGSVFIYYGGFGTGESANPDELKKYAGTIEDINIPSSVQVVALGEATHGNAEFQALKLDVFKVLVERYGVRAFVLEADYGGCDVVNRYIHGAESRITNTREAAQALGFPIYRTKEICSLIDWMLEYNKSAEEGDDLRFYGNDMQLPAYNLLYLAEACDAEGIDAAKLRDLTEGNSWNDSYNHDERVEIIDNARTSLASDGGDERDLHFGDILLQNLDLGSIEDDPYQTKLRDMRAKYMTDNVMWALEKEKARGNDRIFISAHNGHVARYPSAYDMGSDLADRLGDEYYTIGTGYYKTSCNFPVKDPAGPRTKHTFFSHDPIGNAAKKAGIDTCYIDFANVTEDSSLYYYISDYHYMGSLGEGYSILNKLLPITTREFQQPSTLYNSMIYVTYPTPTVIESPVKSGF